MSEREAPPKPDYERLKIAVDVWKHGVSVQMHFNDIEMRIRALYFTILAAAMGLVGVVEGKRIIVPFLEMRLSLTIVVIASVIPISMLFYFLDRHWYHRLLQGAVLQCGNIEKQYASELPEIQLGAEISKASPVVFAGNWRWLFFFVRDPRFRRHSRLHSDQKIEVLYKSVMWGCAAIVVVYGLIGGIQIRNCALLPHWFGWSCGDPEPLAQSSPVGSPLNLSIPTVAPAAPTPPTPQPSRPSGATQRN